MNNISFRAYLVKIAIIFSLYVLLPVFLGMLNITGTFGTYLVSVICFLTLTIIASKLILEDNRYIIFFICAFLLEITLGLVHYTFFVDPAYFESDGEANSSFWFEYRSVVSAVGRINFARDMHGALHWISAEKFGATHPEIWHIISWPFYFIGHKWLNYSALNAFGAMLTSMNILFLYNKIYDYDARTENKIKYWTAFFPTFLLCGTVWRDPFGIALVSIGIVLATLSGNTLERAISTLLFCSAAFVQRTMYTLLALISSFWGHLARIKNAPP